MSQGGRLVSANIFSAFARLRLTRATTFAPETSCRARAWKRAIIPQPMMAKPRGLGMGLGSLLTFVKAKFLKGMDVIDGTDQFLQSFRGNLCNLPHGRFR